MPLGREVRDSGLAIPLVLLVFGSIWLFPLITALVAGDIVAAEDSGGTLKTILTRSVDRGQIFVGKLLAALSYTLLALVTMGTVGVVAGIAESGWHPLTSLSGTTVSAPRALLLTVGEPRDLPHPARGDHVHRRPALDRHAQQRGRRRRHADDRAALPAGPDPARARRRRRRTS